MAISGAFIVAGVVFFAGLIWWGNRFRKFRRTTIIGLGVAGGAALAVAGLVVNHGADASWLVLVAAAGVAAAGLFVLAGGPVVPGDLGAVSERDVAPTVLHLLGLPKSRELDGQVLEAAFSEAFRRDHPVRLVDSYGRRPPARAADSSFDRDVLEELKSLGYIQ